jgi:hypothetical protein
MISASVVEGMNHEFTWWEMQLGISKSETNSYGFTFPNAHSSFFYCDTQNLLSGYPQGITVIFLKVKIVN